MFAFLSEIFNSLIMIINNSDSDSDSDSFHVRMLMFSTVADYQAKNPWEKC